MALTASGIYYPDPETKPRFAIDMQTMAGTIENLAGGSRKAIEIATTESRSITTFGYLTTADKVNVVVPAKSIVRVRYRAMWKQASGGGVSEAAIFVGSNQIKIGEAEQAAPRTQAAVTYGSDKYHVLYSMAGGLASYDISTTEESTEVTTGQILGAITAAYSVSINGTLRQAGTGAWSATSAAGVNNPYGGAVDLFNIAPGTYDIGVQFKCSAGPLAVSVKNRHLYVEVIKFT